MLNTLPCPKCGKQPSLDVSHDWEGKNFPEYQFVCWLDDIYGSASSVIGYAVESWNEVATRTSVGRGNDNHLADQVSQTSDSVSVERDKKDSGDKILGEQ